VVAPPPERSEACGPGAGDEQWTHEGAERAGLRAGARCHGGGLGGA